MPRKEIPFVPLTTPVSSPHTKSFSIEVCENDPIAGETRPRRNHKVGTGKLSFTPENGVNTIFDVVMRGVRRFGDAPALGTRSVIGEHVEVLRKVDDGNNGREQSAGQEKRWSTFERGPYSWMSFKEYGMLVQHVGAGYRKLGMKKGDKVHVYAGTRLADQNSFALSNSSSPVNLSSNLLDRGSRRFVPCDRRNID